MRNFIILAFVVISASAFFMFTAANGEALLTKAESLQSEKPGEYPVAVLAGGCFWCVESEYRALDGVLYTRVGYMGGALDNPGYRDITTGQTGHAEVVEVTYDPDILHYEDLIRFFLTEAHDPTQLNRQGVDVGTQYRSAIFPVDEHQEQFARDVIAEIEEAGVYSKPIVTTIEPIATFWEGEEYHQQYYEKYQAKTGQPHLRVVLKKARKEKKKALQELQSQ